MPRASPSSESDLAKARDLIARLDTMSFKRGVAELAGALAAERLWQRESAAARMLEICAAVYCKSCAEGIPVFAERDMEVDVFRHRTSEFPGVVHSACDASKLRRAARGGL